MNISGIKRIVYWPKIFSIWSHFILFHLFWHWIVDTETNTAVTYLPDLTLPYLTSPHLAWAQTYQFITFKELCVFLFNDDVVNEPADLWPRLGLLDDATDLRRFFYSLDEDGLRLQSDGQFKKGLDPRSGKTLPHPCVGFLHRPDLHLTPGSVGESDAIRFR